MKKKRNWFSWLNPFSPRPESIFAKLMIQWAVIKMIRKNSNKILTIKEQLDTVKRIIAQGASLAMVRQYVQERVEKADLSPEDKFLYINLLDIACQSVVDSVGNNMDKQTDMMLSVVEWIQDALSSAASFRYIDLA